MNETTLQDDRPTTGNFHFPDRVIVWLAIGCGVSSLVVFGLFLADRIHLLRLDWPLAGCLLWDTFLSTAFFLQHSGMVRRRFRVWLAGAVPGRYHGVIYSISSGVVLIAVSVLWQSSPVQWISVQGVLRWVFTGITLLALGFAGWSFAVLHSFDPLGIRPLISIQEEPARGPAKLVIQGPYRWVRHPLYFSSLVIIWFSPSLSADRLLFNLLWTAWIWVGTSLEEVGLWGEFGDQYQAYRQQVPMLIPYRRAVKSISNE